MSKKTVLVFTENFFDNLEVIHAYYKQNKNTAYFKKMTDLLFNELFPLLETQPNMGRPLQTGQYLTVSNQLRLQKIRDMYKNELKELCIEHFCVLYIIINDQIVVLAIKDQTTLNYSVS